MILLNSLVAGANLSLRSFLLQITQIFKEAAVQRFPTEARKAFFFSLLVPRSSLQQMASKEVSN